MIEIEDKIVSDDLIDCYFECDYCKCKGICCVEGDSGAPLEEEECTQIEDHLDQIAKYMTPEGIEAVGRDGVFVVDVDGDLTTTLVKGAECAYTFMEEGFVLCAIERAFRNGDIPFNKPISCHLYPIRASKLKNGYTALNYHHWVICKDAVMKGEANKTKVFMALKEPICRAYGEAFFGHLEEVERLIENGEIEIEED